MQEGGKSTTIAISKRKIAFAARKKKGERLILHPRRKSRKRASLSTKQLFDKIGKGKRGERPQKGGGKKFRYSLCKEGK